MTANMTDDDRGKLLHAIMLYDRSEEKKRPNIYRLGLLLRALESVERSAKRASLARALYDNFNDRLLTRLEKAVGLTPTFGGGGHDTGRPA